ncbi:Forkhead domain protein [Candidatus Similichlamydia laticola]|uniref:Forkhead domain protein n=2 Tax=Candidatus Similichlamydia laticola TaxID=2170265 RepID=A0A369KB26_9BACT|nr:Forkhead domain protein [Candidatus Similichlamydia laticola]
MSEEEHSSSRKEDSPLLPPEKEGAPSEADLKVTDSSQEFNLQDFIFSPFSLEPRAEVWALHVLDGPNNGAQSFLESGRDYFIGRDATVCDIVLLDPRISKKHLLLSIRQDHRAFIQDLSSTNGATANGKPLEGEEEIDGSLVIGLGSSSVLIVNTQAPQKTVVLPSEEELRDILRRSTGEVVLPDATTLNLKRFKHLLLGILTSTLLLVFSLIPNGEVEFDRPPVDLAQLEEVLSDKSFGYEFREERREVVLSGHVHKEEERFKVLSQLSELPFVEKIDAQRLIIDELLCREFNIVLIPQWPGVILTCPVPGEYLIEGFVETKETFEELQLYLQLNFPLTNQIKNQVIVEEELLEQLNADLQEVGPNRLAAELIDGELIVAGTIFQEEEEKIDEIIKRFQEKSRYKVVRKGLVSQSAKDSATGLSESDNLDSLNLSQDISARYPVSGYVKKDGDYQIYLQGKAYKVGDILDGMKILSIEKGTILLENELGLFKISFFSK